MVAALARWPTPASRYIVDCALSHLCNLAISCAPLSLCARLALSQKDADAAASPVRVSVSNNGPAFCGSCGTRSDGAKFCGNCGAAIAAGQPAAAAAPAAAAVPVAQARAAFGAAPVINVGGGGNKCGRCGKAVYAAEKVMLVGHAVHRLLCIFRICI